MIRNQVEFCWHATHQKIDESFLSTENNGILNTVNHIIYRLSQTENKSRYATPMEVARRNLNIEVKVNVSDLMVCDHAFCPYLSNAVSTSSERKSRTACRHQVTYRYQYCQINVDGQSQ